MLLVEASNRAHVKFYGGVRAMPEADFGKWLREARERKGWNTTDLAAQAGMSQPYVSMLENGSRNPRKEMILKIAGALEVDAAPGFLAAGFVPVGEDWVAPSDQNRIQLPNGGWYVPKDGEDPEWAILVSDAVGLVKRVKEGKGVESGVPRTNEEE